MITVNNVNLSVRNSTTVRQGIQIEIVILIYMTLEAILSIGAGILAHSALLAAFGAGIPSSNCFQAQSCFGYYGSKLAVATWKRSRGRKETLVGLR